MKKIRISIELIWRSFWMSPGNFLSVLAGTLLQTGKNLIGLFLPALLISMVEIKRPFWNFLVVIAVYSGTLLFAEASQKALSLLSTALGYRVSNRAALSVGQKAIRMNYAFWEDEFTYEQCVRAAQSTWIFSNITDLLCENWISSILTLIPVMYIFSQMQGMLVVILAILIVFEVVVERKVDEKNHILEERGAKWDNKVRYNDQIITELKYGKELRLYHAVEDVIEKYEDSRRGAFEIKKEQQRLTLFFQVFTAAMTCIKTAMVYFFAVDEFQKGGIALSQFVLFVGAISQFTEAVKLFIENFAMIGEVSDYYLDYKSFMTLPEESEHGISKSGKKKQTDKIQPNEIQEKSGTGKADIELKDVSFRYPGASEDVLKHINLKIPYGSKIAIVGENGSGKSTLAKVLMRLYPVSGGELKIGGKNVEEYRCNDYWALFAPVFQDYILHPYSLKENIAFLDSEKDDKIWDLLKRQDLFDRIQNCARGLDTFVTKELDSEGTDFSGGEKQKLAMVRALYKNPLFFVFDEPTAALDPLAELKYFQALELEAGSKTAIYITHRMASAKFSDTVIVLDHGEIVEQGSFSELLRLGGRFAKMFQMQSTYYK